MTAEPLFRQFEAWGFNLDRPTAEALLAYVGCLEGYVESNVVGTRDRDLLLRDHVLDSLSCLLASPVVGARRLIDVGSGAGFPGIPLKVYLPGTRFTLVEATLKKVRFIRMVVEKLGLTSVEVIGERAEVVGHVSHCRGKHDVATARALAPLPELVEYCVPLVDVGGSVVAMKARIGEQELKMGDRAAAELGAEITEEIDVKFLPEVSDKKRVLIVLTKTAETPERYPRRTGVPKKHPLGRR